MTEEDLVTAMGRNPGAPAPDEPDPGTTTEEDSSGTEGDGETGTEGRNPG